MACPDCGGYIKRVRGQFQDEYKKLRCLDCEETFILSGNVMVSTQVTNIRWKKKALNSRNPHYNYEKTKIIKKIKENV